MRHCAESSFIPALCLDCAFGLTGDLLRSSSKITAGMFLSFADSKRGYAAFFYSL